MNQQANLDAEAQVSAADSRRHADFSRAVLQDLYRYPRKRYSVAFALWLVTGAVGGHRFYLDRMATGLLMLFTGAMGLVWWIVDLFLLKKMVLAFNAEQARREAEGLPPAALSFMPPLRGTTLPPRPAWVAKRGGRGRLAGDVLVLAVAGLGVGMYSASRSDYEAVTTIVVLCAITLLGARWDALATMPVLRALDRWSHRLRLYYYTNDPGGPLKLFFRPIVGLLTAPYRQRARAEARLYLQLGAWFTIVFTALDILQGFGIGSGESGFDFGSSNLFMDLVMTFASIYAFAAPIGAILTTHILLERSDTVVWMLAGVALAATALGMASGI